MITFLLELLLLTCLSTTSMATQKVIVVGGGLAGLCASIEALNNGAEVIIIEKEKNIGGNSMKATSGINGAESVVQEQLGVSDSWEDFMKDTIQSGGGLSNESLAQTLAQQSKHAISFLVQHGVNLDALVRLGGHSSMRSHRFKPKEDGRPIPVGFTIVSTLKKFVEGKVTILTNSRFSALITENNKNNNSNKIIGIRYTTAEGKEKELYGVVVLTAGGFGHDKPINNSKNNINDDDDYLLCKHAPTSCHLPTTNGPWATGDVLKIIDKGHKNIVLTQMDQIQIHPTAFINPSLPIPPSLFLAPESLRGFGGVLLDPEGERFVNELERRDHVTSKMMESCIGAVVSGAAYLVLNQEMVDLFGAATLKFYASKGLVKEFTGNDNMTSIDQLADFINVDVQKLKNTLSAYGRQNPDKFGKMVFPVLFKPEVESENYYVSLVTPAIHYTMGGLMIDKEARVIERVGDDDSYQPVAGLYAAGEVTGGVHGSNRLGGNSLLECVVFGRIAGTNAAILSQKTPEKETHNEL